MAWSATVSGVQPSARWTERSGRTTADLARQFADVGVEALVVTEIGRDGTLEGPDTDGLARALRDGRDALKSHLAMLEDLIAARDWLAPGVQARIERPAGARTLRLGPEPLIPAQTLLLSLDGRSLRLVSDGFLPFSVQATDPGSP